MDIKKILFMSFLVLMFFSGCKVEIANNYTYDETVDKYFNSKYKSELIKNDIKIVKCVVIEHKMIPMYYDKFVVNTYNPLIYIKYINEKHGYAVYFDSAYKFKNKQEFINDLDTCMNNISKIETNRKSWK